VTDAGYTCPGCRSPLTPELSCVACGTTYPRCGNVPILIAKPGQSLAVQAIKLAREISTIRGRIEGLRVAANLADDGALHLVAMSEALEANLGGARRIEEMILSTLTPHDLAAVLDQAPPGPIDYGYESALNYGRRDWGGEPECELEILELVRVASERIETHERPARTLVVGSGTGRLADELASRFGNVHTMDLSLPMLLLHELIAEGPLHFNVVHTRNRRAGADVIAPITCSKELCAASATPIAADITAPPWPPAAFDCIVAAYVIDVVPLSQWLPGITRLLAPGGVLIILGPLGYQHDSIADQLAADQLVERLRRAGYKVDSITWARTTHLIDRLDLLQTSIENMVVAAVRTGSLTSEHVLDPDSVLELADPLVIESRTRITNVAVDLFQATLQTSAGPVVLPPVAVHALGLVNGEARYAEILEAVADIPDSKSIPETTRRELDACIQHLLDIRVLSARRR
jgi:SAM-dependent methyltransferase